MFTPEEIANDAKIIASCPCRFSGLVTGLNPLTFSCLVVGDDSFLVVDDNGAMQGFDFWDDVMHPEDNEHRTASYDNISVGNMVFNWNCFCDNTCHPIADKYHKVAYPGAWGLAK